MNIIRVAAKTYRSDMFIAIRNIWSERGIVPTLKWLKKYSPSTVKILYLNENQDGKVGICKDYVIKNCLTVLTACTMKNGIRGKEWFRRYKKKHYGSILKAMSSVFTPCKIIMGLIQATNHKTSIYMPCI